MAATQTRTNHVVGVRFSAVGKMYHFKANKYPDLKAGDKVIVETKRGRQMGDVVKVLRPEDQTDTRAYKTVKRAATPRDLVMLQMWQEKELPVLIDCREAASTLRFSGVKWVKAEYNYDGSTLTIFYSVDDDGKASDGEIKKLRDRLHKAYPDPQIVMQRIGPRDVAKLLGGYGACGAPRCCSTFLTEFSPISIKMAKVQGLSLNPEEITGMCGRLRCCLVFEYEQYAEATKKLPKRGKRVGTPHGMGKVINLMPLKNIAIVDVDFTRHEVHQDDIIPWMEYEALMKKAAAGCSKHEGGGCDCGAAH